METSAVMHSSPNQKMAEEIQTTLKEVKKIQSIVNKRLQFLAGNNPLEVDAEKKLQSLQSDVAQLSESVEGLERRFSAGRGVLPSVRRGEVFDRFITAQCHICKSKKTTLSIMYAHLSRYHKDLAYRCPGEDGKCTFEIGSKEKVESYLNYRFHVLSQHCTSQLSQVVTHRISCRSCEERGESQEALPVKEYCEHLGKQHPKEKAACWFEGCRTLFYPYQSNEMLTHIFLNHVSEEEIRLQLFLLIELTFCRRFVRKDRYRGVDLVRQGEQGKRRGRYEVDVYELKEIITYLDRHLTKFEEALGEGGRKKRAVVATTAQPSPQETAPAPDLVGMQPYDSGSAPYLPPLGSMPPMSTTTQVSAEMEFYNSGFTPGLPFGGVASSTAVGSNTDVLTLDSPVLPLPMGNPEDLEFATVNEIIDTLADFEYGGKTFTSLKMTMRHLAQSSREGHFCCPGSGTCRFPATYTEKFINHFFNMHLADKIRKINPYLAQISCMACQDHPHYDNIQELKSHIQDNHGKFAPLTCWVMGCGEEYQLRSAQYLLSHVTGKHMPRQKLKEYSKQPGFLKTKYVFSHTH